MAHTAPEHKALPAALLRSLEGVPGFDEAAFRQAHDTVAPTSIRLHPQKGGSLFNDAEHVPWHPLGRYLAQRPLFTADPLFHAGAYYVQEASSMLVHHFWKHAFPEKKNGLRVLDLCAAPGGKSTLLASLLDEGDLLICNEAIRSRAGILHENMVRWGYTNTWVCSNDPRDLGTLSGYFDAMLVDAPCSGSGLFRKDPAALNEWTEGLVTMCASRQRRILADAWPCLEEGGVLLYATCSFSPEEDEQMLEWLSQNYALKTIRPSMPAEWGITEVESQGLVGYRCFPDKTRGEGFFIAAMRKQEASGSIAYPRFRPAKLKHEAEMQKLLRPGDYAFVENAQHEWSAMYAGHEVDFRLLRERLYLRSSGVLLGQAGPKEWLPSHELALSLDCSEGLPQWQVSREEAIRFLSKEELIPTPGLGRGWCLIVFEGRALGWVKVLGNRLNNYLPKSWRIRMTLSDEDRSGA